MNKPVKKIPTTGYTKYNQFTPVESKFSVRNSLIHSTKNFRNHAASAVKIPTRKLSIRMKCFSFILFSRHRIKRCNKLFLSSIKASILSYNLHFSSFTQLNNTGRFRMSDFILPITDNIVYRLFYFLAYFTEISR